MEVTTPLDQLFFTTVNIRATDGTDEWSATGLIHHVETDQGQVEFLVTNKHVFEGASTLDLAMISGKEKQPLLGRAHTLRVDGFGAAAWKGHPDPRVDVAVMPMAPIVNAMRANSTDGRGHSS